MAKREQEGKLLKRSFYFSPLHRTPDGPMLHATHPRELWTLDSLAVLTITIRSKVSRELEKPGPSLEGQPRLAR